MATLKVILLEDNKLDAELTLNALSESGLDFQVEQVDTRDSFLAAFSRVPDVVISDYEVPAFEGTEALSIVRRTHPDLPFIFVTGALGEERAIETLKAGATDFVLKHRLGRLVPAVTRALRESADRKSRLESEQVLQQSEDRYNFLTNALPQIVWTAQPDGSSTQCNKAWYDYTGQDRAPDGNWDFVVHPDDRPEFNRRWHESIRTGRTFQIEFRFRRHDGIYRWHVAQSIARRDETGQVVQWIGSATDVDDRKRADVLTRQSESLYRLLTEAVPGVFFTNHPDGSLEYINPVWTQYTGQSVQGAMTNWADMVHPLDQPRVDQWWSECIRTGIPKQIEYRVHTVDGGSRWLLVRSVPLRGEDGKIIKWVGTATDIDAQKQAEADYQRLLGQLDAIIGNMNEGLAVADAAGNLLSINTAGLRMHGYNSSDNYRQHIREFPKIFNLTAMDGQPLSLDRWPLARALRGESFSDVEVRIKRVDSGHEWTSSFAGGPIRGPGGAVEMAIVTFRDVTAQKQAATDLALAKEQAETANRMKDEFLATLSHELRTPLNAIVGWTQLLMLDASDPADLSRGLQTIERNAQVQTQLVEDLLDVSRIISGKLRLNAKPTDLRMVLDAAADAVRPTADARGVTLTFDTPPVPVRLNADPDRIQQVIWNLLSNAIKFTPRGGAVRTNLVTTDESAELQVHDSGQGISPEFLPHVFERFRQADGTMARQHGGLGLGLAIVRHLVELHGGTVAATSEGIGKGATFTVQLPLAPVDAGAHQPVTPAVMAPVVSPLRGLKVLVVDDEPDARDVICAVLRRQQVDVTPAANAADALTLIKSLQPDVLVSDIGMPAEDGFSLIRKTRLLSARDGGATPAIALTAYARAEDRDKALRAGFQKHLTKPVDAATLIAAVATLTGRNAVHNPVA